MLAGLGRRSRKRRHQKGQMESVGMQIFKGIPVSPGVAIGRVFILDDVREREYPHEHGQDGGDHVEGDAGEGDEREE